MSTKSSGVDLLDELARLIAQLPASAEPISQWSQDTMDLTHCIAAIFRAGLRRSFAQMLFTNEPSFWPFVREFSAPETVVRVRQLQQAFPLFKNQAEREHAWVICTLNHADLSMYLQVIRGNGELAKVFYSASGGGIFMSPGAMDRLDRLVVAMEESHKFSLDPAQYVEFLGRRSAATGSSSEREPPSATELVESRESLPEGRLYSPYPMVGARVAAVLEDGVLADLEGEQYQGSSLSPAEPQKEPSEGATASSLAQEEEDKGAGGRGETLPISDHSEIFAMAHDGAERPLAESDISDASKKYSPISDLYASVVGSTPRAASPAGKEKQQQESPPPPQDIPTVAAKRDTLHSPIPVPESPAISEAALERGEDELQSILEQPRSSKVVVVLGEAHESVMRQAHPVFVGTPSPVEASGSPPTAALLSPRASGAARGLLGLPALFGRFGHLTRPLQELLSGLVRLSLGAIALATFTDEEDSAPEEGDAGPEGFSDPELGKIVIRTASTCNYWSDSERAGRRSRSDAEEEVA